MSTSRSLLLTAALAFAGSNAASAGTLGVFTSDASGFHTNTVWYDDGQEVTVIDTQFTPALANAVVADIRRRTKSPITRVIVTHPSPDKFNALSVFHALGAESWASARTAAAMKEVDAYKRHFWIEIAKTFTSETYPKVEPVQKTFSGQQTLRLRSGETLTLFQLPQPGVASDQIAVRIDATGDLVVGDLVAHKAHAWLEGGITGGKATPTLEGWREDLRQLLTLGRGKVYGGRGEAAPVGRAVSEQLAYLDKAEAIVSAYVRNLGAKASELMDSSKAGVHHGAIQTEFVKAFPSHAHPELIGYGVYGLAQSKVVSAP